MSKANETEQKIRTAMEHAAPDVLEDILSSCNTQKGEILTMTNTKKKNYVAVWAAVAACLVLICTGMLGINSWRIGNTVDSTIMLDVNPSLSIAVNAKERVLHVTPLNEDAEEILDGMDLKGTDLNVAVNAVIGSMLQKGYLSDLQNSVLVTVENKDTEKSYSLEKKITGIISDACAEKALEAAILTQNMEADDDALETKAEKYGISAGKAALIQKLTDMDKTLTFETLAPLSVNEIMLLAESRGLDAALDEKTGTASDKAYIGAEKAKEIALSDAGVSAGDVTKMEVEMDSEDGAILYEVEFKTADMKFEYEILASDGTILEYSKKADDDHDADHSHTGSSGATGSESFIGEEAAKQAALSHAGTSLADVKYCNAWIEYDDGVPEYYEVEFEVNRVKYEYEIGLTDGMVLDYDVEQH